jgi:hypothetical protein
MLEGSGGGLGLLWIGGVEASISSSCLPDGPPMVLRIAHFMARMHRQMAGLLRRREGTELSLEWFLYVDKLAGDDVSAAPSLELLNVILRRFTPDGNVRFAFFVEGDTVQEDLLADNVAGLFNEHATAPQRYPVLARLLEMDRIHWERGE